MVVQFEKGSYTMLFFSIGMFVPIFFITRKCIQHIISQKIIEKIERYIGF